MTLLALWYTHTPEGRRFLQGRDFREMLVAAGVIVAYVLLRTRPRRTQEESRWRAVARGLTATTAAAALWMCVDLVRDEDWIFQLLEALPQLHENAIRYSLLISAGWAAWSVAIFEALRWRAIRRHARRAELVAATDGGRDPGEN